MPVLARWMIKAALAYLLTALILGLLVTAGPPLGWPSSIGVFRPVYLHLLMVGWVTQLIFGVVYWMFPKYSREHPRGSERLGWLIFWLLNAGLILRVVGEPWRSWFPAHCPAGC